MLCLFLLQIVDRYWTPHKIDFPVQSIRIETVSAGPFHCAAVSRHGGLYTWGDGFGGRLGHGTHESRYAPTFVDYFNGEWLPFCRPADQLPKRLKFCLPATVKRQSKQVWGSQPFVFPPACEAGKSVRLFA